MPCFSPLKGYRGHGGLITFSPTAGFYDRHIEVSCGQCIGCRLERSRQWAMRILHEASQHEANSFVTLTYSDAQLPEHNSLRVRDWQLFAKRFRKSRGKFRFYHCGEYGERTSRPHYHACIFGHDFQGDRTHYKTISGNPLYTSTQLTNLWQAGHAVIGNLTFESAAYVARYVTKKVTGDAAHRHYNEIDYATGEITAERKPEYSTMSRRPGIGHDWYQKHGDQVYPRDEVIVNGRPVLPPKFYDSLYERENPSLLEAVKNRRIAKAKRHKQDLTPERLLVRAEVAERAGASFAREPNRRNN